MQANDLLRGGDDCELDDVFARDAKGRSAWFCVLVTDGTYAGMNGKARKRHDGLLLCSLGTDPNYVAVLPPSAVEDIS